MAKPRNPAEFIAKSPLRGELLALQVVQGSSAGVKAVEQAIVNDVVGGLKVFAAANVQGRQRRQVQPVGG